MSTPSQLWEDYQALLRKQQEEKTRLIEVKTKGTDKIQSYARDMPNEYTDDQDFDFEMLQWALDDPASPELAVAAILRLYSIEGKMVRYLALAEVLHDQSRGSDYRSLSTEDKRLRNFFTAVDVPKDEADNAPVEEAKP